MINRTTLYIALVSALTAMNSIYGSFETVKNYLAYPWGTCDLKDERAKIADQDDVLEKDQKSMLAKAEGRVLTDGKVLTVPAYDFAVRKLGRTKDVGGKFAENALYDQTKKLLEAHDANVNKSALKSSLVISAVVICVAAYKYRAKVAEQWHNFKQRFSK